MRKTISLSEKLGISRKTLEENGVFDATLGIDTKLFIDPKCLINSDIVEFSDSRRRVMDYFKKLLQIHRQSEKSLRLRNIARDMLAVPEPKGLSIGYGNKTDKGTSISKNVANKILHSASEILAIGIEDEEIIELLGLFVDGYGPDSISDLTVHIAYNDFCSFTQRVCLELNIETKLYKIDGQNYNLPTHPFLNCQLIFIPYAFLRKLPIASSWDEISEAASYNRELRKELNKLTVPIFKEIFDEIKEKSREEFQRAVEKFSKLLDIYQKIVARPYDLIKDDCGYYSVQPFVDDNSYAIKPTSRPGNIKELVISIRELIDQFRRSIEENGGNKILYRRSSSGAILKNKPQNEDVSQILFYLIADIFCNQADIVLSRESDAGRGPVDFSLATGYKNKVLVEIKKSNNPNIIDGFKKQIKAYQKSENAQHSFYVVILVKENKRKNKNQPTKIEQLKNIFEENIKSKIKTPELVVIDGLVYPSPSKL